MGIASPSLDLSLVSRQPGYGGGELSRSASRVTMADGITRGLLSAMDVGLRLKDCKVGMNSTKQFENATEGNSKIIEASTFRNGVFSYKRWMELTWVEGYLVYSIETM